MWPFCSLGTRLTGVEEVWFLDCCFIGKLLLFSQMVRALMEGCSEIIALKSFTAAFSLSSLRKLKQSVKMP